MSDTTKTPEQRSINEAPSKQTAIPSDLYPNTYVIDGYQPVARDTSPGNPPKKP